ncbi:MAG: hypothetical protein Q9165_003972 [Trypethelium subeluteriae]
MKKVRKSQQSLAHHERKRKGEVSKRQEPRDKQAAAERETQSTNVERRSSPGEGPSRPVPTSEPSGMASRYHPHPRPSSSRTMPAQSGHLPPGPPVPSYPYQQTQAEVRVGQAALAKLFTVEQTNLESQQTGLTQRVQQIQRQQADIQRQQAEFQRHQQAEKRKREAESQRQHAEIQKREAEIRKLQADAERRRAEFQRQQIDAQRRQAEMQKQHAEVQKQHDEAQTQQTENERKQQQIRDQTAQVTWYYEQILEINSRVRGMHDTAQSRGIQRARLPFAPLHEDVAPEPTLEGRLREAYHRHAEMTEYEDELRSAMLRLGVPQVGNRPQRERSESPEPHEGKGKGRATKRRE